MNLKRATVAAVVSRDLWAWTASINIFDIKTSEIHMLVGPIISSVTEMSNEIYRKEGKAQLNSYITIH